MAQQVGGQIINLESNSADQGLNTKYRRNGKLQSCEPCRKSKLKCDHVVPVCRRCIRRKCIDQCVYHPNPLSQSRQTRRTIRTIAPPTPSANARVEHTPSVIPSVEADVSIPTPAVALNKTNDLGRRVNRARSAPPLHTCVDNPVRVNPGFFGATNFTSLINESLGQFGVSSADLEIQRVFISHERIVRGCQVLSFLKDWPTIIRFVGRYYEIGEGESVICPEPLIKEWLMRLWCQHADTLKAQDPDKIFRLSELIWRNTLTPLAVREDTTPLQWARSATGENLRWSVVGIIAAIAGQCANTLDPTHEFLKEHKVTRPEVPRQMNEIASTCLTFCRDSEALDDLFTWLLMENTSLTGSLKGDGSYALYQESGELINAVVALGLHIDVKMGRAKIPLFLEEMRRRVLMGTYYVEMSVASFLGRPPRMTYRYCNLSPALDIPTSLVCSDKKVELAAALAALDKDGFNTSGVLSRITWHKMWCGFAIMREDVLDLSIGQYSPEEILHRAEVIQKKGDECWERLPPFIKSIRDGLGAGGSGPEKEGRISWLLKQIILQGFRGHELMLQRVLIRKAGASSEKLVRTASLVFQDVLQLSRRNDIVSVFYNDISSILAIHGIRSAFVIAIELLKQEQLPNYPRNPGLPRSRTIQDLSVFAARLGDVFHQEGAFAMCDQGRKVIERILDKILSPPPINPADRTNVPQQSPQQSQLRGVGEMDGQQQQQVFASNTATANRTWPWYVPDSTEYPAVDLNLGVDVPLMTHDGEFVNWLESVDWETTF